jgi:hypothetical protein
MFAATILYRVDQANDIRVNRRLAIGSEKLFRSR